jgi:hypothetical protein
MHAKQQPASKRMTASCGKEYDLSDFAEVHQKY